MFLFVCVCFYMFLLFSRVVCSFFDWPLYCACHMCAIPLPARLWIITPWETSWKRHCSALLHWQTCSSTIYNMYIYLHIYIYIDTYGVLYHIQHHMNHFGCINMISDVLYEHTNSAHCTCPHMHVDTRIHGYIFSLYMILFVKTCCARNCDVAINALLDLLVSWPSCLQSPSLQAAMQGTWWMSHGRYFTMQIT